MKTLEVYDPPMCCSSGVCGPGVDTKLIQFKAALKKVGEQGVTVRRFNPSQQQAEFAANAMVSKTIEAEGMACLPLILVDGVIVSRGSYPDADALAGWVG